MKKIIIVLVFTLVSFSAQAAPLSLGGLGLATNWIDFEVSSGDMPLDVWGISDDVFAAEVGIHVEYANGLTSWAVYSGITPSEWGTCCGVTATEVAADGFLAGVALHGVGRSDLPMAWGTASNEFTSNFDLDYDSGPDGKSDWRSETSGWGSVEISLYSSAYAVTSVPEASSIYLLAFGLLALFGAARRKV